jgi:hypothetical protein
MSAPNGFRKVAEAHGWRKKGSGFAEDIYTHPLHPGHHLMIPTSPKGSNWNHYSPYGGAMSEGAVHNSATGRTPGSLDSHLAKFNNC